MRFAAQSGFARRVKSQTPLWVGLIALLAAVLRVFDLGVKSFSPDEAFSVAIIETAWSAFWHLLVNSEANMAFYYVLLRVWRQIGDTPSVLRALSVLFGVATVPVIYLLGKNLFSRRAGLISALLLAVNVFHITYSQNARSYSLLVLLVTCSSFFFTRCIQSDGCKSHVWYVLTLTAALYTHFFAALVLLAHFGSWTFLPRRLRTWSQLRNMVAIAALGIPLALFVAFQGTPGVSFHLDWAQTGRRVSMAKDVYHFLTELSGSGLKFGIFVLACVLAAREWWARRSRDRAGEEWPFMFLGLWLLVPSLVTVVVSYWKFVFVLRFLIICLPAALLLFGEGLALIRPNWLSFAVVSVAAFASLIGARSYYRQPGPSDWRAAISYLAQNAQSGDMLIFANPYCRYPFEYNLRVSGKNLPPMTVAYTDPANLREFPVQTKHVWVADFTALGHRHSATLPSEEVTSQKVPRFRFQRTMRFPGVEIEQFGAVDEVQGAAKH